MTPLRLHSVGGGERHYFGIHGWGGGYHTFDPLIPHLPDDVTLHSFDLPGYGESPRLERWDAELLVEVLDATLDTVPVESVTLLGNCSGADFGLMLARRRPGSFARLVLIDPFAYFPWYFELLSARGFGRLFYASAFETRVGRWLTNRRLREHRAEQTHLTASFETLDHDVVYAYLQMLRQLPPYTELAELAMPIDIAYGERTFPAVQRSVALFIAMWEQARAACLPGAGHLPIQEATAELAAAAFSESRNQRVRTIP